MGHRVGASSRRRTTTRTTISSSLRNNLFHRHHHHHRLASISPPFFGLPLLECHLSTSLNFQTNPFQKKRGFFSRCARSNSYLELATMTSNQQVPEKKVKEGEGEQGENVDEVSAVSTLAHCRFNLTAVSVVSRMIRSAQERKAKQRDDSRQCAEPTVL
ncbi:hypothetical protein BDR03DRAFT_955190 [Suillus americanus]|nr:hypothetical protein BDR03DRAFT_955190 [Suillus americanus]